MADEDAAEPESEKTPEEAALAEGEEGGEPTKKSKKKLIIIGAAALIVLLIAGGAAMFLMGGDEHAEEEGHEKPEAEMIYFDMPQMLVNLNTSGKQTSFIKATITLELADKTHVPMVEANLPRLMDSYNTFMREMRPDDLYGSSGVYRLREELLLRANKLLAPAEVSDVLFREILIQ